MATARLLLPIGAGYWPDGSGAGNAAARPDPIISTAAQTANTPKVSFLVLLFDAATDQHWTWTFQLPGDYVSGGSVQLLWGAKVVAGDVTWKAGAAIGSPASSDLDALAYNAADLAAAVAVPGVVGQFKVTTIPLTMTGADAGDWINVFVGRDAGGAAGDAVLKAVTFTYENA